MKRLVLLMAMVMSPALGRATLMEPQNPLNLPDTSALFSSFSQTTTFEWGCPVADRVRADSKAEAIQKVRAECIAEANRAAADKPEVAEVLETKVIWPDVKVIEKNDGFHLSGTFFIETLVLQRSGVQ